MRPGRQADEVGPGDDGVGIEQDQQVSSELAGPGRTQVHAAAEAGVRLRQDRLPAPRGGQRHQLFAGGGRGVVVDDDDAGLGGVLGHARQRALQQRRRVVADHDDRRAREQLAAGERTGGLNDLDSWGGDAGIGDARIGGLGGLGALGGVWGGGHRSRSLPGAGRRRGSGAPIVGRTRFVIVPLDPDIRPRSAGRREEGRGWTCT